VTVNSIDEKPVALDRVSTSLPLDWSVSEQQQAARAFSLVLSCAEPDSVRQPLQDRVVVQMKDGRSVAIPVVMVPLKEGNATFQAPERHSDPKPTR
jgi:hypothetical protein